MFNTVFKIVYLIEFITITAVRTYFTSRIKKGPYIVKTRSKIDMVFMFLESVAMLTPLVYVFSSILDFANYNIPSITGWVGTIFFAAAIVLLWKSHKDLGDNWDMSFSIKSNHNLVTQGVYKFIRHPLYASHMIWAIAQVMMLSNWIAGFSFLAVFLPHYLYRVRIEEKMMIDKFGAEYIEYMKSTGRLIPKIF